MAVLTEEQSMLRDAARAWTQEKSPVTAFRKLRDSKSELGFDAAVWSEMGEMGWAGVIIPEALGGSEFGYLGLGLILEETGRNLVASPLLSTASFPTPYGASWTLQLTASNGATTSPVAYAHPQGT